MKIFHIRTPRPRKGHHFSKTLCGAPITSHDNSYSWQVDAVGDFRPCEKCVEIRGEMLKARQQ